MLKSNNFQHYKLSTLSFLNIKIPSFSFLKKAILGLYKNLFWHISRKIGKILENFQKVPFEALLKQQKIFSKSLMKMDRFPKKKFLLKNQIVTISGVFCHIFFVASRRITGNVGGTGWTYFNHNKHSKYAIVYPSHFS